MKPLRLVACILLVSSSSLAQNIPVGRAIAEAVKQSCLTQSGGHPFHLKATTIPLNKFIPEYTAEIEEYWISPDKWRRTIRSKSFEQTIVVNGDKRFEKNSSNYYPKWLNDIVIALFEVAPPQLVAEIEKLPDKVPGKRASVRYQPSSTDGKVTNTWWGSVDLVPPGVLKWISGKNFSAGYEEYGDFYGKYVAHTIETFPPIPHGDVTTTVELSELSEVNESLFDIERPTPPADQLRMVTLNETEYRKSAVAVPQMKWAPVQHRPTEGVLSLYIVTDTTGAVREAEFISSNNMGIGDSAEALVKQWRFKPMTIDGVPTEVQSTMTFAFATTIEGDQAKYQAASFYFKRGRDLTYPRTDNSTPFRMSGVFSWNDGSANRRGVYEEVWLAPNRWRREVTIGGIQIVESRIDDDFFRIPAPPELAKVAARAFSLYAAEFPGYAYYSPDWDWHIDETMLLGQRRLRISMGPLDHIPPGQYPPAYYFDEQGLVMARSQEKELIQYEDFEAWADQKVPQHISLTVSNEIVFDARVETMTSTGERPDDLFRLPGIKPRDWTAPPPW